MCVHTTKLKAKNQWKVQVGWKENSGGESRDSGEKVTVIFRSEIFKEPTEKKCHNKLLC